MENMLKYKLQTWDKMSGFTQAVSGVQEDYQGFDFSQVSFHEVVIHHKDEEAPQAILPPTNKLNWMSFWPGTKTYL